MKKKVNYILFAVCFILTSCASVNEFTINVQKPAKVTFPYEVSSIVVANNTVDQPKNVNHKTYRYTQEVGTLEISADGLSDVLVGTLTDNLVESNAFNGVFLSEDLPKTGLSFLGARNLKPSQVDSVLKKYDGDALLALDRYVALLSSDIENVGDGIVRNFYAVQIFADFSLYDKFGEKKGAPILYRDTLYWSEYTQGMYLFSDPLPSPEEALEGAAIFVGDEMAKKLTPQWVESQRWVYSNASTEMRRANMNLTSEKREEAREIWMTLYDRESDAVKKSRLASNIALSYELNDDLQSALDWVEEAASILTTANKGTDDPDFQRIVYYKKELESRMLDFKLLDLQHQQ